jgi:anti-sigma factor RsiW
MNEVRNDELMQLSMRRELAPEEWSLLEAHFAARPEDRARWEEERALSRAVQSLPDMPISSNFTARVLQTIEAEQSHAIRKAVPRPWLPRLLPRLGLGALAASVAFFSAQKWFQAATNEKFARDISLAATDLATVPNPEVVLQDFDAIRELGQMSAVSVSDDDELLRLLQ